MLLTTLENLERKTFRLLQIISTIIGRCLEKLEIEKAFPWWYRITLWTFNKPLVEWTASCKALHSYQLLLLWRATHDLVEKQRSCPTCHVLKALMNPQLKIHKSTILFTHTWLFVGCNKWFHDGQILSYIFFSFLNTF